MKTFAILLFLFGFMAPAAVVSQTHQTAKPSARVSQLAIAEAYTTEINEFIKQNAKRYRIFAAMASTSKDVGKWRAFKSDEELEGARVGDNMAERAYVWLRDDKVVAVSFIFEIPSRDWSQYVKYYFREDGSLVKRQETFNTLYANIGFDRNKVYGPTGKLLHVATKYYDMRTGQPRKPNGFAAVPPPTYKSVRNLPFYALL